MKENTLKLFLLLLLSSCTLISSHNDKIIVYLHGMGISPLKTEGKNIAALRELAIEKNYHFISPEAENDCTYLDPAKNEFKCWDHIQIEKQLRDLEDEHSLNEYVEVVFIGYSNGAYFLGGAFQRSLFSQNVSKVVLVSGGGIGNSWTSHVGHRPEIYIENASEDKSNSEWVENFYEQVKSQSPSTQVYFRSVDRKHRVTAADYRSLLRWVLD